MFPHCLPQCYSKKYPVGKLCHEAEFPLANKNVNTTLPFRGRYRGAKGSKVRMINRRHLVRVKKKHTLKKKRHANEVSKEIKEIGKKPIEITLE